MAGAASLAALLGLEIVGNVPLAEATTYVQYSFPFPRQYYDHMDPFGGFGTPQEPRETAHQGADFNGKFADRWLNSGDKPAAVADGNVVFAGWYGSCLGNAVILRHDDGMYSGYFHLSSISLLPQRVARGTLLGNIGSTGTCSGGVHLHLAMATGFNSWTNTITNVFDPITYIDARLANPAGPQEQPVPAFDITQGATVALVMNRTLDNVIAVFDETHWQEFSYTSSMTPAPGIPQFLIDFVAGIAHSLPNVPYDALGWANRSNKMPGLKKPLYNVDMINQTITPI